MLYIYVEVLYRKINVLELDDYNKKKDIAHETRLARFKLSLLDRMFWENEEKEW